MGFGSTPVGGLNEGNKPKETKKVSAPGPHASVPETNNKTTTKTTTKAPGPHAGSLDDSDSQSQKVSAPGPHASVPESKKSSSSSPTQISAPGPHANVPSAQQPTAPRKPPVAPGSSNDATTQAAIKAIAQYEGFEQTAYKDSAGVWTIGYGRTTNTDGSPVRPGQTTTELDEQKHLEKRVAEDEAYVREYMAKRGYSLSENQVAALTSFTYNLGKGALSQVTADGTRDLNTVGEKMKLYNKAGGQYLQGLQNRRNSEYALFRQGEDTTYQTANQLIASNTPAAIAQPPTNNLVATDLPADNVVASAAPQQRNYEIRMHGTTKRHWDSMTPQERHQYLLSRGGGGGGGGSSSASATNRTYTPTYSSNDFAYVDNRNIYQQNNPYDYTASNPWILNANNGGYVLNMADGGCVERRVLNMKDGGIV